MNMRWIPVVAVLAACELPGTRVVLHDTRTLEAADLVSLDFIQGQGDLVVEPATDGVITLDVTLTGPVHERGDERAKESLVHLLEADGADAFAEVWLDDPPPGYGLDTVLRVPAELIVAIDDGSGDLRIDGLTALSVVDGSGDLDIFGVSGPIRIEDGSGDLTLGDCSGELSIFDGSGDIAINGHVGDAKVEDGSGDLAITDHAGDVTIADGSGDIRLQGVDGQVVVERDGSGEVISNDVEDVVLPGA